MWKRTGRISLLLLMAVATSSCFGSFNLTKKLYRWNSTPDGKWTKEAYFLVTGVLLPIYGLAAIADGLVINSIEFWSGENPVSMSDDDEEQDTQQLGQAALDGDAVTVGFGRHENGEPFLTVTYRVDAQPERVLFVSREGLETRVVDQNGRRVLSAQHLPDGGMVVRGLEGERLASVRADEIQAFVAGLPTGEASPSRFAADRYLVAQDR